LNAIRASRFLRIVVVMAMVVGWFVLSNHCALGLMTSPTGAQKVHGCCHHGTSQPMKEPANSARSMECCKSLHAVVSEGPQLPVAPLLEGITLPAVLTAALPEPSVAASRTGPPPDVPSFTELVLHRSLRSHAPPFVA